MVLCSTNRCSAARLLAYIGTCQADMGDAPVCSTSNWTPSDTDGHCIKYFFFMAYILIPLGALPIGRQYDPGLRGAGRTCGWGRAHQKASDNLALGITNRMERCGKG